MERKQNVLTTINSLTNLDEFVGTKTEIVDNNCMILQVSLNRVHQSDASLIVADRCHGNNHRQNNVRSDGFRIQPRVIGEAQQLEVVRVQVDVVFR